ncbi:hypothetical protein [Actinoplanes sp. NPDC049118]|uniref:hypothetical protein n=1 Tax=Actinoplanes sp. NPDC049118 TaxID=3155769 RepID=UPI0033D7A38F
MSVYATVVYVAASSQTQVFHEQLHWVWPRAVGAAAFIEGTSLAFALTAHRLRLEGERACIARVLTWVAALFGAGINYFAHAFDPALPWWLAQLHGIAVGVSSLVGIILWEIRSSARSRKAMRLAEKKKSLPKAQLGLDFWIRYPRRAYWAWTAMVAKPQVRTREAAINQGDQLYDQYRARRALAQARRKAVKADKVFLAAARKAAMRAAAKGEPGPALYYLCLLAQRGPSVLAARPKLGAAPDGADTAPNPGRAPGEPDNRQGGECAQTTPDLIAALQALTGQIAALTGDGRWPLAEPVITPEREWRERLDELDAAYRTDDGGEVPIPGRRSVIVHMAARRTRNRYAWTSHKVVDQAIHDLRARRNPSPAPAS